MDIHCGRFGIISFTPPFKPGDPAPTGYNDWHAWADVQHKAGLRQVTCGVCSLWKYPQELSDTIRSFEAEDKRGNKMRFQFRTCLGCEAKQLGDARMSELSSKSKRKKRS
jgi:hypothetical protein